MSDRLPIPGSNTELFDGSVVQLERYPGVMWIVHNGWYTYNGLNCTGWYFCSIPAQTVVPVNTEDLMSLVVVSGGSSDPHCFPDHGHGCHPHPPRPLPPAPVHPCPGCNPQWPGTMHFLGSTPTEISEGSTAHPVIDGKLVQVLVLGDVVRYQDKEFIWDGSAWYELGSEVDVESIVQQAVDESVEYIEAYGNIPQWGVEDGIEG